SFIFIAIYIITYEMLKECACQKLFHVCNNFGKIKGIKSIVGVESPWGEVRLGLYCFCLGVDFYYNRLISLILINCCSNWWPLILIIIGFVQLAYRRHSSVVSGMLFIVVGGLLLIGQFVDYNMWNYIWPIILIIVGFSFLLSRSKNGKYKNDENHIKVFTLFSGANIRNQSTAFKGGTVTAVFGGSEIDLRNAVIA